MEKLRVEIDKIDNEIMNLLDKRFEFSKKIGIYKIDNKIEIEDKNREEEIFNKIYSNKYNNQKNISEIFKKILKESKNIQEGLK